ncbi:MAG: dihydrofolate reductase [Saprospiraceae bacterium]|nr:dihydrofolate reductase [Saprospiraceae bacterium]
MEKVIVAAVAENGIIGRQNELPWHLPADLAFLKKTIRDCHLLSGRKSFESSQGRKLFNEKSGSIVITRQREYETDKARVANSIPEAIQIARREGAKQLCILGGEAIYRQTMDMADELIITEIHEPFDGDTRFPAIDPAIWVEVWRENHEKDEANPYDYSFVKYRRR